MARTRVPAASDRLVVPLETFSSEKRSTMRKTLAVVILAAVLTGGTATYAYAYADDVVAAPPVTQAEEDAAESKSDKSGLLGLLGLAKQKENHGVDADLRRQPSGRRCAGNQHDARPAPTGTADPVRAFVAGIGAQGQSSATQPRSRR